MGNRYLLKIRADKWFLFHLSAPGIEQTAFFPSMVLKLVAHHIFSAKDFKIEPKTLCLVTIRWLAQSILKMLFSLFYMTFNSRTSPSLKQLQGNPSEKADYLLAMLIFISFSLPSGPSAVPLVLKEEAL